MIKMNHLDYIVKNDVYSEMSNDFIDRYAMLRLTKEYGTTSSISIYGNEIKLPTSGRYHLYSISGIGDINLNLSNGLIKKLRYKWLRCDEAIRTTGAIINVVTDQALTIPSKSCYMRVTDNDAIIFVVRIDRIRFVDFKVSKLYLHSYVNTFLSTGQEQVLRYSTEFDGISSIQNTNTWNHQSIKVYDVVDGYLISPDLVTNIKPGQYIDTTKDNHIVKTSFVIMDDCGPYKSEIDNIRKIAVPIDLDPDEYILNYNDCDVYLINKYDNSYYGVLLTRNSEKDMRTLTHRVFGISSSLITKALKGLHSYHGYKSSHTLGFMFFIRGYSDKDKMVQDLNSLKTLHAMSSARVMGIIAKDKDRTSLWRASNLEKHGFSKLLDGNSIRTAAGYASAVQGLGYEGIVDLLGKPIHHITSEMIKVPELYYGRSLVLEYDDNGFFTEMYGDRCEHYIPSSNSGTLEFIRGRLSPSLYLNYNDGETIPLESRIYEIRNGKYLDITYDNTKVSLKNNIIIRTAEYTRDIYYRTLDCIYKIEKRIPTATFISEDVVVSLSPKNFENTPMVILNNEFLMEGIDFVYDGTLCFINKPLSATEASLNEQKLILLFRTVVSDKLDSNVYLKSFVNNGTVGLNQRLRKQNNSVNIVTIDGMRIPANEVNDFMFPDGTIYTVELAMTRVSHLFNDTDSSSLIDNQIKTNKRVDDFMKDELQEPDTLPETFEKYKVVSPFMNRVLNIALLATDSNLNFLTTYTSIREYLKNHVYTLPFEPHKNIGTSLLRLVTVVPHPSPVPITVSRDKYDFLVRVAEQYGIKVDLENTLTIG
jgi:hypothetical protein